MINITKVGVLKGTGEVVYQHDAGAYRVFKTVLGKVVDISEVDFTTGPVKPINEETIVTKETPEQDERSAATVAIMEEANENL